MPFSEYIDDAARAVGKAFTAGKQAAANTNMDDVAKGAKNIFKDVANTATTATKSATKHKLFDSRRNKLIAQTVSEKKFVSDAIGVGVKDTLKGGAAYMGPTAKKIAKSALRPTRIVDPGISNLFTGHELKRGVDVALGGAAIAFGLGLGGLQAAQDDRGKVSQEHVGNLQGLSYDAVANGSGGKKDLGATGDLVFGLHNQRRG